MEEMENYSFICDEIDLKDSVGQRFYINDTDIAVFKLNKKIFVVSNICPHQQASSIYEGFIENECVVCPLHGWTFSLETGKLHNGSRGLDTFPVKVVDGKVYGVIKARELNW